MNPSWLYFFLDLCIAAALLYGPGSVAFRFAGFRLEASICLAPSFSLSVFVVVGILLGLAGINVSNVKFLLICLLVTLVLLIVSGVFSRLCERKRLPHVQYDSQNGPTFSLIALYLLIAAIFVTVLFILPIDGPYSFSTSNDSSAHLDFIRVFVESGTYSTLHVSQDVSLVPLSGFYPAAYHVFCAALTALPGCTVTMASNIAVVVICGAVYPLGSLLVCSRLFGSRDTCGGPCLCRKRWFSVGLFGLGPARIKLAGFCFGSCICFSILGTSFPSRESVLCQGIRLIICCVFCYGDCSTKCCIYGRNFLYSNHFLFCS